MVQKEKLKRVINPALLKKYEGCMEKRDEYIDLDIRGEKPRKIAEWAEVVKWMSVHKADESFSVLKPDFDRMMGTGKPAIQYVRNYLKKFGIPTIRVHVGSDKVKMWSRTPIRD